MVVSEMGTVEMGTKLRHMVLQNLEALRVTFRAADPKGSGLLSMSQFRAALFRVVGMPVNASGVVGSKFHQARSNKVEYERWLKDFLRTVQPGASHPHPIATMAETDQASGFDLLHRLVISNYSKFLSHIRTHDEKNLGRIPADFFRNELVTELGAQPETVAALFAKIPADMHGEIRYKDWIQAFVRDAYRGSTMFHSWFLPAGIKLHPEPVPESPIPLPQLMPQLMPPMMMPHMDGMHPDGVHVSGMQEQMEFMRMQSMAYADCIQCLRSTLQLLRVNR